MKIEFNYDPWRGGFCLRFNSGRGRVQSAFNNLMSVYFDGDKIHAVESFFGDHGGVPLRGLHKTDEYPEGVYQIKGTKLCVGSFQLRQSPKKLDIWFSTGNELPRTHWTKQRDEDSGVTAWFSTRKAKGGWPVPGVEIGWGSERRVPIHMLAGLSVEFCRTTAVFPISSVYLALEDFK